VLRLHSKLQIAEFLFTCLQRLKKTIVYRLLPILLALAFHKQLDWTRAFILGHLRAERTS